MSSVVHVSAKSTWKPVKIDLSSGDFEGLISLEVLDEYELVKGNNSEQQRVKSKREKNAALQDETVKKKKKKRKKKKAQKDVDMKKEKEGSSPLNDISSPSENESPRKKDIKTGMKRKSEPENVDEEKGHIGKFPTPSHSPEKKRKYLESDMEGWRNLYISEEILRSLQEAGFTEPTPIQAMSLPHAIRDRLNILGAAETGSGKTLAFGIPVLEQILHRQRQDVEPEEVDKEEEEEDSLSSGDEDHSEGEEEEGKSSDEEDEVEEVSGDDLEKEGTESDGEDLEELASEDDDRKCIKVIKDVDMSWVDKALKHQAGTSQKGHAKTSPKALILEPTRELAMQVKKHLEQAAKYTGINVVCVVGGFSIAKQERLLKRCPEVIVATPGRLWELMQQRNDYLCNIDKISSLVVDEADRMVEKGHFEELEKVVEYIHREKKERTHLQTYVFSATLTMLHPGPLRTIKKKVKLTEKQKLELLTQKLLLKSKVKVIDLTRKVGTVESLTEAKINCTVQEKDVYLYYFLKQFPGKTLVFTNSKDCIRRLVSVFTLLKCSPLPLHADMHQRQRLKNLERFAANENGFLLASDVAARGLDIPSVQHVIHYQVPQTVENYVHRSGRTARANKEGLSVVLVGQDEVRNYRKIIHSLNRGEDLPQFPVDHQVLSEVKSRVNLARQIDVQEHRFKKKKLKNDWFQKTAEKMDIEIDDEHLLGDLGDSFEQSRHKQEIRQLKLELDHKLQTSLIGMGNFYGKYPTKMGSLGTLEKGDQDRNALQQVKKAKIEEKGLLKALSKKAVQKTIKQVDSQQHKSKMRKRRFKNKKKKSD